MSVNYKRVGVVSGALLIIVLSVMVPNIFSSDIRQILEENPEFNLILVTNLSNKFVLIGRSPNPEYDFVKWKYEGYVLKGYNENDLVFSLEPRVLMGNSLMWRNNVREVELFYDDDTAVIVESFDVVLPYTREYLGSVNVSYSVLPFETKPRIVIYNASVPNLRVQLFVWLDNHEDGESIDLDYGGATNYSYEDIGLDWNDNVLPSAVYKFGNGKVQINYPSGSYDIDPTISVGGLGFKHGLVKKDEDWTWRMGKYYESDFSYGNIPLIVEFSRDFVLKEGYFDYLFKRALGKLDLKIENISIEVGVNQTFDRVVREYYYEYINTSYCFPGNSTCNNYTSKVRSYNESTVRDWAFFYKSLAPGFVFEKGVSYVINFHAEWKGGLGERSVDLVPTFNTYSLKEYAWFNSSWMYRIKISVQSERLVSTQSDFPVYVDLSDLGSDFFDNAQADGDDIRVTTSDEVTELPREVVTYSAVSDTGEIHFRAPSISHSSDTDFYVYYGNADVSDHAEGGEFGKHNVWNNSFTLVQHLFEDPSGGTSTDSTVNSNDGTVNNMESGDLVLAKVGDGYVFDGSNEYITVGDADNFDLEYSAPFTIEFWTNNSDFSGNKFLVSKEDSGSNFKGYFILIRGTENDMLLTLARNQDNGTRIDVTSDVTWTGTGLVHAGITYKANGLASDVNFYQDGAVTADTDLTDALDNNTIVNSNDLHLAARTGGSDYYPGIFDEVRFSNVSRSADWLNASFNNQDNTSAFYTVSAQESLPALTVVINDIAGEANNSVIGDSTPDVNFTINTSSASATCELVVDDAPGFGINYTVLNDTPTILTVNQTLSDKKYEFIVNCNASQADSNSSEWTMFLDTEIPNINLNAPSDLGVFSTQDVNFNFTAIDKTNDTMIAELVVDDVINVTNSSVNNNTLTNVLVSDLSEGNHSWYVNVTDFSGTNKSDVRTVIVDLTSPAWVLDSVNNSYQSSDFFINWTLTELNLDTKLYSNDSFTTNNTDFVGSNDVSVDVEGWGDDSYIVNVWANDSGSNIGESTVNVTIDTTDPVMFFISPTPTNDTALAVNYVYVNVSANDSNFNSSNVILEWFNTTGTLNSTLPCAYNSSHFICEQNNTNLGSEKQSFNVYVTDLAGNTVLLYQENSIELVVPDFTNQTQDRVGNPDFREDVFALVEISSGFEVDWVIIETNVTGSAANFTVSEGTGLASYDASFTINAANLSRNETFYWMYWANNTIGWNSTSKYVSTAKNLSYFISVLDADFLPNNATLSAITWSVNDNNGTFEPVGQSGDVPAYNFSGGDEWSINLTFLVNETPASGVTYYYNTVHSTASWTQLTTSEQKFATDVFGGDSVTMYLWMVLSNVQAGTVIDEGFISYADDFVNDGGIV